MELPLARCVSQVTSLSLMMPAELIGLSPRGWVSSWELWGEASGIKPMVGKVHGAQ